MILNRTKQMKLHNTLTSKTDDLQPLNPPKVTVYTCGLTVYSQPHIGNWAAYIYWDVLVRSLKAIGYDVVRVQNVTDVGHLTSDEDSGEDKMEKGAKREGLTAWNVADKYIKIADHEAYDLLGLLRPDYMPRATEYIPQQIAFVEELEKRGFTYTIASDGLYFDTSKLDDYGKLAKLNIEGLQPGARVAYKGKKNVTDFAVWKYSPEGQKRDMEWDSPWGKGFPGWHLECSAMARALLGDQIDIHTGGIDHIPVHHTNEIAQTEVITGKPFAKYWLHNSHIKVNGTKISKSLGNVYTLQDITDKGFSIEAYKLLILSSHYRTEGNFTWAILEAAQNRLNNYTRIAALRHQPLATQLSKQADFEQAALLIKKSLESDLNTPQALAALSETLAKIEEIGLHESQVAPFNTYLQSVRDILGIDLLVANITDEQRAMIKNRKTHHQAKDWEESDAIRSELKEQGIGLADTANGTVWYRL